MIFNLKNSYEMKKIAAIDITYAYPFGGSPHRPNRPLKKPG